jgi:hypothetical protein
MNTHKLSRAFVSTVALCALVFSAAMLACVQPAQQPGGTGGPGTAKTGPVRIGLSMDTLK